MPKSILYLLFFLSFQFIHSQQPNPIKPDYEKIKNAIENKELGSYYPKLLERLKVRDTTLTSDEFRNLYYGYTFQKEYEPHARINDENLKKILQKENLIESDYQPFITLANKSLEDNPFDLRLMHMLAYVYHLSKEEAMAQKTAYIMNNIIDTIISTGDGLTCESAFHVISTSDEYILLSVFEAESQGQSLIGSCDYLRFEKGKFKIDGLYFNVSKLFESMMRKY